MAETVSFLIKISDDGTFKKVEVDADSLRGAIGKVKNTVDELKGSIINWSEAAQSFSQLKEGIDGIVSVVGQLTEAYGQAEVAEAKLANNMRNTMAATEEDVAAVNQLIDAQKELGVVDDDVQRAGAQELATYLEKRSSLEKLIPVMNDMLAQQYGLEASQESAAIIASMLGKVMDGQVGALSRYGYKFDEAQEKVLKFGTEEERAAVLADVVESAVGGMNETLAQTDAGQTKKLADGFADVGKWVGGLLSPLQSVLNSVQTLGMAAFSVSQLVSAFNAVRNSSILLSLATRVATAVNLLFSTSMQWLATSLRAVAAGAVTAKVAIRGLMSATVIGAALAALGVALEHLVNLFGETSEAEDAAAVKAERLRAAQEQERSMMEQTRASLEINIARLRTFNGTKEQEKKVVAEMNQAYGETMGYFSSVAEWYQALTANSKAYCDQMVIEARTRRLANEIADLQEENRDIKYDENGNVRQYSTENEKTVERIQIGIQYVVTGISEVAHSSELAKAQQQVDDNNRQIAAKQKEMAKLMKQGASIKMPVIGAPAPTPRPTATTNTHNSGDTSEEPKGLEKPKGLIGRGEALLRDLREQVSQAEDEESAIRLQSIYKKAEGELKALKVRIGLEKPDKQEVKEEAKTHVEQLHESLQQAQRDKDNALSVQARVEAQARIDDIQAQIDAATQGEVTIKAAAEPGYVEKGSDADKRMSWQNALGRVGDLQADIDIGLIGFEEAQGELQKLQEQLDQLGISAKLPELKPRGADKAKEKFDYANRSVQMLGQSLQGLGSALELPELDVAGVLAQAVATMIMGYAEATKMVPEIGGPWAWLAFGATGLAQLTAMVSSIKGMAKFANGGIVSGPTIGLIGEYANASTNPEVIAPLDKLSNMINTGGGKGGTIRLRVSGRDLVGVVQNEVAAAGKSGRVFEIRS